MSRVIGQCGLLNVQNVSQGSVATLGCGWFSVTINLSDIQRRRKNFESRIDRPLARPREKYNGNSVQYYADVLLCQSVNAWRSYWAIFLVIRDRRL